MQTNLKGPGRDADWGPTSLSQHASCDLLRDGIIDNGAAPKLLQGGGARGPLSLKPSNLCAARWMRAGWLPTQVKKAAA